MSPDSIVRASLHRASPASKSSPGDLWWSWHAEARAVFRRLDYGLWRATAHNPRADDCGSICARQARTPRRPTRRSSASTIARMASRSTPRSGRANTWWTNTMPHVGGQTDRLLLRGVRAAPVAADLRRRPRRAGRRSLQGSERPRRAAHRRRLHVSAGLLPPARLGRRLAGGSYERLNWADAPIEQALTPDGKPCITAVPLGDRSVLVAVWRVRLGRVTLYLLDTSLEENAPWDRELTGAAVWRRSRNAHPAGDHPRRRRRPRAEGARRRAGRVPPERRARRLRRPPAHPRSDRTGRVVRRRARGNPQHDGVHDAHAGAGRATTRFRSAWSRSISPAAGERSAPTATGFSALGSYDNGGGVQFNMTALAIRSAGSTNAVSQLHGAVTRAMFAPMWPDVRGSGRVRSSSRHQRRRTCRPGSPPTSPTCSRRYLGADWIDRHDDPSLWEGVLAIPDEELWAVRQALAALSVHLHPRTGAAALGRGARRHPRAWSRPARCSSPTR